MATLRQGANLALSTGVFQPRVAMALVDAASDIENEDPAAENHAARLEWALRVLGGQAMVEASKIMWRVALNPVLAEAGESGVTDGDLQWVVNGLLGFLIPTAVQWNLQFIRPHRCS